MGMRWKPGSGLLESKCSEEGKCTRVGMVMKKDGLNTWRMTKCNRMCKYIEGFEVSHWEKGVTEMEREKTGNIFMMLGCNWQYCSDFMGFSISR